MPANTHDFYRIAPQSVIVSLCKRRIIIFTLILCLSISFNLLATTSPTLIISGAPQPLEDNIRAHLNTASESCELNPHEQQRLFKRIQTGIRRAAKALGYYQINFQHKIQYENSCWQLLLEVIPGQPVLINRIEIKLEGDAKSDSAFNDYLQSLPIKTGEPANHGQYEKIKADLISYATSRGYFYATFIRSNLLIDTENYIANIEIHYDSGRRVQFGEIEFSPSILSLQTLHRFSPFKPGDPYDTQALSILQRNLDSSGYFNKVSIRPQMDALADNRVPISVILSARKQHAYEFGAGVATDTGPRALFSYANRYLNERGHKFKYDLSLSPIRSESNLNYSLPLKNPAKEHLDIFSNFLTEETDTSEKQVNTLGLAYTRALRNDWLQTLFLSFQQETFQIGNRDNEIDLTIPGISWSKIQVEDLVYPQSAWRLQSQIRGSKQDFLSDLSFVQAYINGKLVKKIGPGRLLARLELGATEINEFDNLPASIRFFAGGDSSVRGYDYQALGAVDEFNTVIGGSHLITGSIEYDIRIRQNWAVAAFYDQGNAFIKTDNNIKLKRGAGLGLRWLSPIGPIRLDIAKALDDDEGIRIHISMGPDV